MTKTYSVSQLKLADEVIENFRESCPRGYWVESLRMNPGGMFTQPSLTITDDEESVHEIDADDVCKAFERVIAGEAKVRKDLVRTIRDMWESEDYCGDWGPGGDFETDDVLVQVAALGEVTYG